MYEAKLEFPQGRWGRKSLLWAELHILSWFRVRGPKDFQVFQEHFCEFLELLFCSVRLGQGNKNYLGRLLKRAAGIIAGRKATDTDIQQTLKWPSLQCRREHQKCIQVYKCINGLAPVYLLDDFHSSEQIHNYDTRNKDLICLPLARTTKFQTCFKYNAAKSWNTLPRNLRHDQSLTSFKWKVKKYLNHFS